jgi:chemotaxis protein methyltransferase CheR
MINTDAEYTQFKQAVASLVPLRLDFYKQQQMERRIRDIARRHQAPSLIDFAAMLKTDKVLLREFEQHLTINVSEFYRNPEAFDYLSKNVLPALLAARRGLRAWSAACSYGAEPYTLSMLLHEAAPMLTHHVYATDIDRAILEKAKLGRCFTREDVQHLPARLRQRYLSGAEPPYTIAAAIQRMVRFEWHDLLQSPPPQSFDLIACRNVVIYFTDEAKARLYDNLVAALRPGGYLFIGATEVVGNAAALGLRYVAPCFYAKDGR